MRQSYNHSATKFQIVIYMYDIDRLPWMMRCSIFCTQPYSCYRQLI